MITAAIALGVLAFASFIGARSCSLLETLDGNLAYITVTSFRIRLTTFLELVGFALFIIAFLISGLPLPI